MPPGFPVSQGFWPPAEREKKHLPIWMMRFPIGSRWRSSGELAFPNFDKSNRRRLPLLKPLVTRDSGFLQDKFQQLHTNDSGVRVGNCELNLAFYHMLMLPPRKWPVHPKARRRLIKSLRLMGGRRISQGLLNKGFVIPALDEFREIHGLLISVGPCAHNSCSSRELFAVGIAFLA